MTELEQRLRDLGEHLDYPPTPDVAAAVARRVERPAPSRLPARRRTLVVALAALAVAAGAVLAVPQARTAILELFGLRGVEIERVTTLPSGQANAELGLGRLVSLEDAQARVPYRIVLPKLDAGRPSRVYLASQPPGGQIGLLLSVDGERVLFTEFRADPDDRFVGKQIASGTRVERVAVAGEPGYWVEGDPHFFFYRDASGEIREETERLAGNVLLWERGERLLRLEGDLTKAEALALARSVG